MPSHLSACFLICETVTVAIVPNQSKACSKCLAHVREHRCQSLFSSCPQPTNSLSSDRGESKPHPVPMSDLIASPVPRGVVVGRPLKVPKLDLIGSLGAPYSSRELHLQELVGLMPVHLKWNGGWGQEKGLRPPHQPYLGKKATSLPFLPQCGSGHRGNQHPAQPPG